MFSSKVFAIFALFVAAAHCRQIQLKNGGNIVLSVSVSGQDDVVLPVGGVALVNVEEGWSGKISAVRQLCDNECDGPRTVAELNLGAVDQYDVSLVGGFNVPIKVVPVNANNCEAAVCSARINKLCPVGNQVVNSLGEVVACQNSPLVFAKVCPKAVIVQGDVTNVLSCAAAESYIVLLG